MGDEGVGAVLAHHRQAAPGQAQFVDGGHRPSDEVVDFDPAEAAQIVENGFLSGHVVTGTVRRDGPHRQQPTVPHQCRGLRPRVPRRCALRRGHRPLPARDAGAHRPLHVPGVRPSGARAAVEAGVADGLPGGGHSRRRRLPGVHDRRPVVPDRQGRRRGHPGLRQRLPAPGQHAADGRRQLPPDPLPVPRLVLDARRATGRHPRPAPHHRSGRRRLRPGGSGGRATSSAR